MDCSVDCSGDLLTVACLVIFFLLAYSWFPPWPCNKYNIGIQLTKDHKPKEYEEGKRIVALGGEIEIAEHNIPRINGLSVSRAFGDLECTPHITHCPDIFNYELTIKNGQIQERFLVLACDGLWDVISNQEVVNFILTKLDEIKEISTCDNVGQNNIALMLAKYAVERGSEDNVSIAIIFFKD